MRIDAIELQPQKERNWVGYFAKIAILLLWSYLYLLLTDRDRSSLLSTFGIVAIIIVTISIYSWFFRPHTLYRVAINNNQLQVSYKVGKREIHHEWPFESVRIGGNLRGNSQGEVLYIWLTLKVKTGTINFQTNTTRVEFRIPIVDWLRLFEFLASNNKVRIDYEILNELKRCYKYNFSEEDRFVIDKIIDKRSKS